MKVADIPERCDRANSPDVFTLTESLSQDGLLHFIKFNSLTEME